MVSNSSEQVDPPVFPVGLAAVAASAQRAGHDVRLINLVSAEEAAGRIEQAVDDFDPEVIGVTVRNIDDQTAENTRFLLEPVRQTVALCRAFSHAPIVVGGAGYSIFPESALTYLRADMGIRGEGEEAFVILLDKLARKAALADTPGLYLPGRGAQGPLRFTRDLDALPFPMPQDQPWMPESREGAVHWVPFQTRRGCPMDCSYCSTASIEGRVIRRHSPDRVVEALARYVEAGYRHFQFVDNTFNLPPSYAEALCDRIIQAGLDIRWLAIIYPIRIGERLAAKMAEAGCRGVSLGFECGSREILRKLNKKFSLADVWAASETFRRHRIRRMGFLLMGGPGETMETAEQSLTFMDSLELDSGKITLGIRIYPNTPLARTAVEEGLIAADDSLLTPRFYLNQNLADWLRQTVEAWVKDRPHWMI